MLSVVMLVSQLIVTVFLQGEVFLSEGCLQPEQGLPTHTIKTPPSLMEAAIIPQQMVLTLLQFILTRVRANKEP